MLNPYERTEIIIDGSNIFSTMQLMQKSQIDWIVVRDYFRAQYNVIRFGYYTAVMTEEDGTQKLRKMLDFLNYNGYSIFEKPTKSFQKNGQSRVKGNVDVEIAADMIMAAAHGIQHMILMTGDGDFVYAIKKLQEMRVKVTVVSSLKTSTPICSDELRRQANQFIELDDIISWSGKE